MDFLASLLSPASSVGAGVAAIQAIAFFLCKVLPSHTVAYKAAREVAKFPAQLIAKPAEDPANPKP